MTECEGWRLLAGASGSTGETGASGQTGLTGEFRLWLFTLMYACMWSPQSPAVNIHSSGMSESELTCEGPSAQKPRSLL